MALTIPTLELPTIRPEAAAPTSAAQDAQELVPQRSMIGAPLQVAQRSQFSKGLSAGTDSLQGSGYGFIALLGSGLGLPELRDYGLNGYQRNEAEAARANVRVQGLEQIDDVGDMFDWAGAALGQAVPSLATAAVGGGVGALVGKAVAKQAIVNMVAQGIERTIAEKAVTGALADRFTRQAMARGVKVGTNRLIAAGAAAGGFTASAVPQQGALYTELKDAGVEDGLAQQLAWGVGSVQGALDLVPEAMAVKKLFGASVKEELSKSFVRGVLGTVAKQGAAEGSTEGAQELLSVWARMRGDKDYKIDDKTFWRVANNTAAGFIVGVATGGGTGTVAQLRAKYGGAQKKAPPPPSAPPADQQQGPGAPIDPGVAPAQSGPPSQPGPPGPAPGGPPVTPEVESAPGGSPTAPSPAPKLDAVADPVAPPTRDTPSAEPESDLRAQVADLRDASNPRKAVFLSAMNLEANPKILEDPEFKDLYKISDADGQGGVLMLQPKDRRLFGQAIANGESRESIIGKLTRSGEGKPVTETPAVVQQKDEQGNVTAETVVDAADPAAVEQASAELEQDGRTVEVNTPEDVLARREAGTAPAPKTPTQEQADTLDRLRNAMSAFQQALGPSTSAAPMSFDGPADTGVFTSPDGASTPVVDGQVAPNEQRAVESPAIPTPVDPAPPRASSETETSQSAEEAAALPQRTDYRSMDAAKFQQWLAAKPELLDEDFDGEAERKARYDFIVWLVDAPAPIQRAYSDYEKQQSSGLGIDNRRGADRGNDVMLDEIDDLIEDMKNDAEPDLSKFQQLSPEVQAELTRRLEVRTAMQRMDTFDEADMLGAGLTEGEVAVGNVLGKHGWLHGAKRVLTKKERGEKYGRYVTEGWSGDTAATDAKKLKYQLEAVDLDANYVVEQLTPDQMRARGLKVPASGKPAYFVFMVPKVSSETHYSNAYGASLTVPAMVRVALTRGLERWNAMPKKFKEWQLTDNLPRYGLEFKAPGGKVRTIAAREISILGAQMDPALRDISNASERTLRAFFQGLAALYGREGGDIAWKPAEMDITKWLTPQLVIGESNGKRLTLGAALMKGKRTDAEMAALPMAEELDTKREALRVLQEKTLPYLEDVIAKNGKKSEAAAFVRKQRTALAQRRVEVATISKRIEELEKEFRPAYNNVSRARFDAAMKVGGPMAARHRGQVEVDARAGRLMRLMQQAVESIDAVMKLQRLGGPAVMEQLRLSRAALLSKITKLQTRIGKVGASMEETELEAQRVLANEIAAMTGEEIYSPPEAIETALEHQEGDFVTEKLESETQQLERSRRGAELIGDQFSKTLNNSAIGTFAPAGPSSAVRVSPAEAARVREQLDGPKPDPVADIQEDSSSGMEVSESTDALVDFRDAQMSARFSAIVNELRGVLGLNNKIVMADSTTSLVQSALENGHDYIAERIAFLMNENKSGKLAAGFHIAHEGTSYIFINPKLFQSRTLGDAVKTMSHELGHAFFQQNWATAAPELKAQVRAAFDRFVRANPDKVRESDAYGQPLAPERQLEEWLADQVAAWVASDRQPRNAVEQFIKDMADRLLNMWNLIRAKYPLDQTAEQFIRSAVTGLGHNKKVHGVFDSFGSANDIMFDTASPLEDAPALLRQLWTQMRALKARSPTVSAALDNLGTAAMRLHEKFLASLHARFHRMNIPAFSEIMKLFYKRAGDFGGAVFDDNVRNRLRAFERDYRSIVEDLSPDQKDEFIELLRDEPTLDKFPNAQQRDEAGAIPEAQRTAEQKRTVKMAFYRGKTEQFRAFMRRMYDYQLAAGLPITALKDYFPQVYDVLELQKEDAIDAIYNEAKAKGRKETRQQIMDIVASLTDDTTVVEIDVNKLAQVGNVAENIRTPFAQALRSRQLDPEIRAIIRGIKDEKGKSRFFDKNLDSVIYRYSHQAVRRSEFNKILGDTYWNTPAAQEQDAKFNPYRTLNRLLTDARKQGANDAQVTEMYDALSAVLGQYNRIQTQAVRKVVRSIAFYQNLRTLMMVTLSSIGEIATIFLRDGDFSASWQSIRNNARAAWGKGGDMQAQLRVLGFAVDELDALGFDEFKQAADYNSKLDRANETFFRMIGLTKWTNFMRGLSLGVSKDYMERHATRLAQNKDTDGDSKRRLEELGLTPADVQAWVASGRKIYGAEEVTHEDLARRNTELSKEQLDSIQKVTGALNRMIGEMVVQPTAAMKPLWRSDEHFALVGQLGSFTYGFLNQVLGRVHHEMTRDGATTMQRAMPVIALAMMIPLVALGLELRELVQYKLWGKDAPTDGMDGFKYLRTLVGRTGVTGLAQLGLDGYDAAAHGRAPFLALLGPTVSQLNQSFTDVAKANRTGREVWKATLAGTPVIGSFPGFREALTPE